MQRSRIGLAALALIAAPAAADQVTEHADPDQKVDQMIDNSKQVFGVSQPQRQSCAQTDPNEIVVCIDRGRNQRVESTAQTDPNSRDARRFLDGGIPTAPQFDHGSCRGQPGCITGGWAPPPVYYVDVTALPQAPEGSEADKIAKGEMPAP